MRAASKKKAAPKRKSRIVALSGTENLNSAGKLKDQMVQRLQSGAPFTIDGGSVEAVDVSVLQILLATQRSAEVAGLELRILAPKGKALVNAAAQHGFFDAAGEPLLPEASSWITSMEQDT